MKKILMTLLLITVSLAISAQQNVFSDSQLSVKYTVEELSDEVNDNFYSYYAFEFENISNQEVSFIPVINYVTESGVNGSTSTYDNNTVITLLPGETITGSLNGERSLTLFKAFLPGNSGVKKGNSTQTFESININYQ